jgi:hypothetical protein
VSRRTVLANAVIATVFAGLALFYVDAVRDRILPPMYDEAGSFGRIDPRPGWVDTGIDIRDGRPIGIVASGKVSTPRLVHDTASERNKPHDVGPEGAQMAEARLPDWREVDEYPAFALLGRVDGGRPFLVGRSAEIKMPGRLELKINCLVWDKALAEPPGTVRRRRREGRLTDDERAHLRLIRGFFGYRTWEIGAARPQSPHLPLTAVEITQFYDRAPGK